MSTLRDDIVEMRKHVERGSFFTYYDKATPCSAAYAAVTRVLDAAESTLPKVTKYSLSAKYKERVYGPDKWAPYTSKEEAKKFAQLLIDEDYSEVSVVEITV